MFVDVPEIPLRRLLWRHSVDSLYRLALFLTELTLAFAGVVSLLVRAYRSKWSQSRSAAEDGGEAAAPDGSASDHAASGEDANAGVVGALRWLSAGQRDVFHCLDPQLRKYEALFMSRLSTGLMRFAEVIPIVGRVAVMYEGGLLAARTAIMDQLMREFLVGGKKGAANNPTVSERSSPTASPTSVTTRESAVAADDEEDSNSKVKQVLILGAGFDSRAYRLPEIAAEGSRVHVIEVDQAAVQATKKKRLIAAFGNERFLEMTKRVEFVSVNFAHEGALVKALSTSRFFKPELPTFVLWEGVTYYLPLSAVHGTLDALRTLRLRAKPTPAEWRLVLDFADDNAFAAQTRVTQYLNWAFLAWFNHPCQSSLPLVKSRLQELFRPHDLDVLSVWSGSELIGRFFPNMGTAKNGYGINVAHCVWR